MKRREYAIELIGETVRTNNGLICVAELVQILQESLGYGSERTVRRLMDGVYQRKKIRILPTLKDKHRDERLKWAEMLLKSFSEIAPDGFETQCNVDEVIVHVDEKMVLFQKREQGLLHSYQSGAQHQQF